VASLARPIWWATAIAIVATVAGLIALFAYSLSEVLANPSLSLEDGYWIGRLPWISIGVDLTVLGASATVVFGAIGTWFGGGRWRRLVVLLPLAVAAFFWFVALMPSPGGVPCDSCPPPSADPFAYAYSLPASTVVLLLAPALVVALLAVSARPVVAAPPRSAPLDELDRSR
jgi:hypothetical protein